MYGVLNKWKIVSVVETILLVDGDPATREPMKFILELNGYRVVEAWHGIEGLQALNEWGADIQIALCAPDLPDMTGPEWMNQRRFLCPDAPALLLSVADGRDASEFPLHPHQDAGPSRLPAPARLLGRIRKTLDERFFERCERAPAA
jgi:CheY-like chemotaxis protein